VKLRDLIELPEGAETRPARPKLGPRKSADYQNSVRHWAELCDAKMSPDAKDFIKSDTSLALRGALVAKDEGRFAEYHHPMYEARWAEPRELADPEVVRQLLSSAGLDGDAALARAESEELTARLKSDTQQAIERGVFGVPTIFVGNEMFWGNDRFELVRHYLKSTS
jgi:2-hydroxychromene-2-carboxylate isomerase